MKIHIVDLLAIVQCMRRNESTLVDEIKFLQKNIDYDSSLYIEVRRNFVLSDALREARKNKFNAKKFIKVRNTIICAILIVN